MNRIALSTTLLIVLISSSSCSSSRMAGRIDISALGFLGDTILPNTLLFEGTPVGGLSGIDRGADGTWYLISDDRSDRAPARFYTARIDLDDGGLHDVSITGGVTMKQPDGTPFPNKATATDANATVPDPESIRVAGDNLLLWTSEGDRARGIDPFIRIMRRDGSFVRELSIPPRYRVKVADQGPRDNAVFEGSTLLPNGEILVSLEEPLLQDASDDSAMMAPVRLVVFDHQGRAVREYAYQREAIEGNGVSEVLAIDQHRIIVVERAYSPAVGNTVRLFEADLTHASDISTTDRLTSRTFLAAPKRLLLDLGTLRRRIDNIEGIAWGPTLANGHRTLVVISDNNFNPRQITQIMAFEVVP